MQTDPRNRFLNHAGAVVLTVLMVMGGLAAGPSAAYAAEHVVQDGESIVMAIQNAAGGDTILVESGTYNDVLWIDKTLTLRGVDTGGGRPVIDGGGVSDAITLMAGGIVIEGLIIQNNNANYGIQDYRGSATIHDNVIRNCNIALRLKSSAIVTQNTIQDMSSYWIYLSSCSSILIQGNTISNCKNGEFISTSRDVIEHNTFSNMDYAIRFSTASQNIIRYNTFSDFTGNGIYFNNMPNTGYWNEVYGNTFSNIGGKAMAINGNAKYQRIFFNDFENVGGVVGTTGGIDNRYHSLGVWQYDYNGQTYQSYLGNRYPGYAGSDADGDGIGDTPYAVTAELNDEYPLAASLDAYTNVVPVLPDLTVTDITLPAVIGVDLSSSVAVTVANTGLADAESFQVKLYADGEVVETLTVDGLAMGAEIVVIFTWTPEEIAQGVELEVKVDSGNSLDEISEDDNTVPAGAPVDVQSSDLSVTAVTLADNVNRDESQTVTVTVANTGAADAGSFIVGLYCDMSPAVTWAAAHADEAALHPGLFNTIGKAGLVAAATVDSLAAGATVNLDIPWTPEKAGVRTLSAWADMTCTVDEQDNANNLLDTAALRVVQPYTGTVATLDPGDSLQAAMDAAAAGDTIVLNPGTYELEETGGTRTLAITGPDLTVKAAGAVVIDGVDPLQYPALVWGPEDASRTLFDGITFVKVAMASGEAGRSGLTFKNCTFGGGQKNLFGDGEALAGVGNVTVDSCLWQSGNDQPFSATAEGFTIQNSVFDGCTLTIRNPSAFGGFVFQNNMAVGVTVPESDYNAFLRIEGPNSLVAGNVFEAMTPGEGNLVVNLVADGGTVRDNRFGVLAGSGWTFMEAGTSNRIFRNDFLGDTPMFFGNPSLQTPVTTAWVYQEHTCTGLMGNHYANYSGGDSDGDGIRDSAANIDGVMDDYPLAASISAYGVVPANLTVNALTLPGGIYEGLPAEITAVLANTGASDAGPFTAALHVNDQIVDSLTVGGLAAGADIGVTFTWTAPGAAEGVVLTVVVDVDDAVMEADETDNTGAAEAPVDVVLPVRLYTEPMPANAPVGASFDVAVRVDPGAFGIAGVQFDLSFDPAVLEITGVAQGALLNQDGAGTYFAGGTIDNTAGTLSGVAGAITTPGADVNTSGVFAVISFTAKAYGVSNLAFSNAIVGDINADPVSLMVENGSAAVVVTYSATGQAAYAVGQTGDLIVGVYSDDDLTQPLAVPVIASLGADATVTGLVAGTGYRFGAFIDSNGNGARDGAEAWGATVFDIVDSDATGLKVLLMDPDLDADNLPDYWQALYAGYNGGAGIGDGDGDADHDGYSNFWELINGTDPTVQDDPDGEGYDSATDQRVAPAGWNVSRSHGDYRPGQSFEVTLTVQYSGDVTAMAIIETLPEGWTYVSANSAGNMFAQEGPDNTLEFVLISLPVDVQGQAVNPFTFSYVVQVPETADGAAVFDGDILARIDDGIEKTFTIPQTTANRYAFHSADYRPADWTINLSELLRVIQLYNMGAYHCDPLGEEGFNPGVGDYTDPAPHSADYNPADGSIGLSELLRVIQIYNVGGYRLDPAGEDGYQPGLE